MAQSSTQLSSFSSYHSLLLFPDRMKELLTAGIKYTPIPTMLQFTDPQSSLQTFIALFYFIVPKQKLICGCMWKSLDKIKDTHQIWSIVRVLVSIFITVFRDHSMFFCYVCYSWNQHRGAFHQGQQFNLNQESQVWITFDLSGHYSGKTQLP